MINIMESKGWSRKAKTISLAQSTSRPFVIEGKIDGFKRDILVDTVADVSIANTRMISEERLKSIRPCGEIIRGVGERCFLLMEKY